MDSVRLWKNILVPRTATDTKMDLVRGVACANNLLFSHAMFLIASHLFLLVYLSLRQSPIDQADLELTKYLRLTLNLRSI